MLHRTTQQVFSVVAGMKIAATNPDATTPRRSDVDFNVQTIKCVIQGATTAMLISNSVFLASRTELSVRSCSLTVFGHEGEVTAFLSSNQQIEAQSTVNRVA